MLENMYRRTPFAPHEWYHCYSRGVEKRTVFENKKDFERFLQTLYLANDTSPIKRDVLYHVPHQEILRTPRTKPLVALGAYCLMPNHFHLLIQELEEGGITKFMRKVGTSYTMYFNIKNKRVGNLFVKPFRSRHIDTDQYLTRVAQYIHFNPIELFESKWKQGIVENEITLRNQLVNYSFSSFPEYIGEEKRVEHSLLSEDAIHLLKQERPLQEILAEMREYYADLEV